MSVALLCVMTWGCATADAPCERDAECRVCEQCVRGVCVVDPDKPPCPEPVVDVAAGDDAPEADVVPPTCQERGCLDAVPSGWDGPLALAYGGPCGEATALVETLHSQLYAPPAVCSCTCSAPIGQNCGVARIGFREPLGDPPWSNPFPANPDFPEIALDSCKLLYPFPFGEPEMEIYLWTPGVAEPGVCDATTNTELPTTAWSVTASVCAPSAPLVGGDGDGCFCAPTDESLGHEARWCISAVGESACPEQVFTERHLLYSGQLDQRACTDDCACDPPADDARCTHGVTFTDGLQQDPCGDTKQIAFVAGINSDNPTVLWNPDMEGARPSIVAPAACSVGKESSPTGDVTLLGARTFCCRPRPPRVAPDFCRRLQRTAFSDRVCGQRIVCYDGSCGAPGINCATADCAAIEVREAMAAAANAGDQAACKAWVDHLCLQAPQPDGR